MKINYLHRKEGISVDCSESEPAVAEINLDRINLTIKGKTTRLLK